MDDNVRTKKILSVSALEDWQRPSGRPWITWLKTVQDGFTFNSIPLRESVNMAENWQLLSVYTLYCLVSYGD